MSNIKVDIEQIMEQYNDLHKRARRQSVVASLKLCFAVFFLIYSYVMFTSGGYIWGVLSFIVAFGLMSSFTITVTTVANLMTESSNLHLASSTMLADHQEKIENLIDNKKN